MNESYLFKTVGFKKHREDLRKYVSVGIAKQFLSKHNAKSLSTFPDDQPSVQGFQSSILGLL